MCSCIAFDVSRKELKSLRKRFALEAGKPIKDSRGEVSRLIDTFRIAADETLRSDGEMMNLEIGEKSKGLPWHVQARPDRAVLIYFALQFPSESGGPQDRACHRGRLPLRPEAGEPNTYRRSDDRRDPRGNGSADSVHSPSYLVIATAQTFSQRTTG